MLAKLFKKTPPRIFLGNVAVVPRTDLKRYFDCYFNWDVPSAESFFTTKIRETLPLEPAQASNDPRKNDLALDIMVTKFQLGYADFLRLGYFDLPLIWRSKITVTGRLYYLGSEKTKAAFSVNETLNWFDFIKYIFSFRLFFPKSDTQVIEYLLYKACVKLLLKMKRTL